MKRMFCKSLYQSAVIAAVLTVSAPAIAHVGHGDEFEATGDIQRIEVRSETDSQMGIQVAPIEPAADGSAAVLIPATALIEADGGSYAFVEYENFYEPVPVTTGTSQGELIEITEGLSVGEQLVTQGGLSLYAQSRRAQPSEVAEAEVAAASTDGEAAIASSIEESPTSEATESGFPILPVAGVGVVALLAGGGALAVANSGKGR